MRKFLSDDEPEPGPIGGEGEDREQNLEQDAGAILRLSSLADAILMKRGALIVDGALYAKVGRTELMYREYDDGTHEYGFGERKRRTAMWCTWQRDGMSVDWCRSGIEYESLEMVIEHMEQAFLAGEIYSKEKRRGIGATVLGKLRRS